MRVVEVAAACTLTYTVATQCMLFKLLATLTDERISLVAVNLLLLLLDSALMVIYFKFQFSIDPSSETMLYCLCVYYRAN